MRNRTENQIRLVLIRHGATAANKEHRYLGKTDEALSEDGILELKKMLGEGKYPSVTHLFSSPMKRCLETAQILYPDQKPVIVSEWEEIDFGAFEGKNYAELKGDPRYQAWIDSNGTLPFPEGESREQFVERCRQGLLHMLTVLAIEAQNQERPICVGCVVHGGTIMALLSSYEQGEYFDYQRANGEGYVCELLWEQGEVQLIHTERKV